MEQKEEMLSCTCCGILFWGIPDDSHDTGFGACENCINWIFEKLIPNQKGDQTDDTN